VVILAGGQEIGTCFPGDKPVEYGEDCRKDAVRFWNNRRENCFPLEVAEKGALMNRNTAGLLTATVASVLIGFFALLSRGDSASVRATAPSSVTVQVRDWKGVQELIRRHRGRVVVLNIWTTTCERCIEEFPQFVQLQETYQADRLACISINCDYDGITGKPPAYYRDDVLGFLKKSRATFQNVMLKIPFLDFLNQIELASTPAVLVYGRDGELVHRFDNDNWRSESDEFTMQQIQTLIDRLIKQPTASTL